MLTLKIQEQNGITIRGEKLFVQDEGFHAGRFSTFEAFYDAFVSYFSTDSRFYNEPASYLLTPIGKEDLRRAFDSAVAEKIASHINHI